MPDPRVPSPHTSPAAGESAPTNTAPTNTTPTGLANRITPTRFIVGFGIVSALADVV